VRQTARRWPVLRCHHAGLRDRRRCDEADSDDGGHDTVLVGGWIITAGELCTHRAPAADLRRGTAAATARQAQARTPGPAGGSAHGDGSALHGRPGHPGQPGRSSQPGPAGPSDESGSPERSGHARRTGDDASAGGGETAVNTPLRKVGVTMLVMVTLLLVNTTYIQVVKADDYRTDGRNTRVLFDEYSRERGKITSADAGQVLASIEPTDNTLK